jgi:transcriptional regulator with XRE-family HTH domain
MTRQEALTYLGRAIAECREARGWSRADLADRLGVTECAVKFWERGRNAPRIETRAQLSLLLEVPGLEFVLVQPPPAGSGGDVSPVAGGGR